jgi:hypothetical protein
MTPPPTTEERERLRALTHETLRPEQVWELAAAVPGLLSSLASAEERARRAEGERDDARAEFRRFVAEVGDCCSDRRTAESESTALRSERDALAEHVSDLVRRIGRVDQVSPADDLRSDECRGEWDDLLAAAAKARATLSPRPSPGGGPAAALEKCMAVLRWHLSAYQRKDEPMMLAALEAGEAALGRRECCSCCDAVVAKPSSLCASCGCGRVHHGAAGGSCARCERCDWFTPRAPDRAPCPECVDGLTSGGASPAKCENCDGLGDLPDAKENDHE